MSSSLVQKENTSSLPQRSDFSPPQINKHNFHDSSAFSSACAEKEKSTPIEEEKETKKSRGEKRKIESIEIKQKSFVYEEGKIISKDMFRLNLKFLNKIEKIVRLSRREAEEQKEEDKKKKEEELNEDEKKISIFGGLFAKAIDVIFDALRVFGVSHVYTSYNGGKDAVVVLHLFRCAHAKYLRDFLKITEETYEENLHRMQRGKLIYFHGGENEFREVEKFVFDSAKNFQFYLKVMHTNYADGLRICLEEEGNKQMAFIIGTRMLDPEGINVSYISASSDWLPPFIRIHPILFFNYYLVWLFIQTFLLPYCILYDRGFTSIGLRDNTVANRALLNSDGKSYMQARYLDDVSLERKNRALKIVKKEQEKIEQEKEKEKDDKQSSLSPSSSINSFINPSSNCIAASVCNANPSVCTPSSFSSSCSSSSTAASCSLHSERVTEQNICNKTRQNNRDCSNHCSEGNSLSVGVSTESINPVHTPSLTDNKTCDANNASTHSSKCDGGLMVNNNKDIFCTNGSIINTYENTHVPPPSLSQTKELLRDAETAGIIVANFENSSDENVNQNLHFAASQLSHFGIRVIRITFRRRCGRELEEEINMQKKRFDILVLIVDDENEVSHLLSNFEGAANEEASKSNKIELHMDNSDSSLIFFQNVFFFPAYSKSFCRNFRLFSEKFLTPKKNIYKNLRVNSGLDYISGIIEALSIRHATVHIQSYGIFQEHESSSSIVTFCCKNEKQIFSAIKDFRDCVSKHFSCEVFDLPSNYFS